MTGSLIAVVPEALPDGGAGSPGCAPGVNNVDLTACFKLNPTQTVAQIYQQPTDLLNILVRNLFVIAGLILFVMILYAGFKFVEMGEKGKEEAKNVAETVLKGFIVMFAAYWIVRIVEIVIGQEIIF